MKDYLNHLFLPRESNNHRAGILHNKSLLFIIIFLFVGQFFFATLKTTFPDVLGQSTNISTQELLLFTNEKRQKEGLDILALSPQLSQAAFEKAKDMFKENYWAHNSPTGTTPWYFIKNSNYEYTFAGENLAKGFSYSEDIVNAWMASPTHRENMLSKEYQDIGFAVVPGKLKGEDVILVVEMFGGKGKAVPLAENKSSNLSAPGSVLQSSKTLNVRSEISLPSIKFTPFIDMGSFPWVATMSLLILFIFVLLLDMIIIERNKIIRLVGHNVDHILFLIGILIIIMIIEKGIVI